MTTKIIKPVALSIMLFAVNNVIAQQEQIGISAPGMDAVSQAAKAPYVQQEQSEQVEFVSAEEKLNQYLASKGWGAGWNKKKQRMFVVYSEAFNVDDPAYDNSFVTKRSVYNTMASMGGKAQVAEFMRTQMSAVDQITAPGTDVYDKLNADFEQQKRKFEAQKQLVMKMMSQVDKAEAAKLAGVTWSDRSKALMDAVIKKLDKSFDPDKIAADKVEKYQRVKKEYNEAVAELVRLEKEAEAIKGQVKLETFSAVETLAKAPIFGATTIAQAESWDEQTKLYEVAVLMVWSHKLEDSARAIMTGNMVKTKPKAGVTVNQWIAKQDLATLVGSRQLIDENGERWFVGAYSTPYSNSASARRKAKGTADLMARKEAVMAVYADVETHKQAKIATQTRNADLGGNDHIAVANSFAEVTRQAVENRQVSGLTKVMGKAVTHPVSGQPIYVVAYAISSGSAREALAMEAKAYQDQIAILGAQNMQKGIQDGYQQAVKAAKDDSADYIVGKTKVQLALKGAAKPAPTKSVHKTVNNPDKLKTQSETILNTSDVDDDDF